MSTARAPASTVQPIERAVTVSFAKPELRVLQVFSVLGMGGAETWLLSLLKYFHERKEDLPVKVKFDVLLTGGTRAVFDDQAITLGARLFYVPFTRANLAGFAREFRRILASGNYHAIHDHQDYIAGLHFLMGSARLPDVRVVQVHNPLLHIANYVNGPVRRLTSLAGKHLLRYFATDIMGTSLQVLGEYGLSKDSYHAVRLGAAHCGFDVSRFRGDSESTRTNLCDELGIKRDDKLILFVGRLDSHRDPKLNQKNPLFALEVARACVGRNAGVHLLMAGGGEPVRAELEAKVRTWGLEKNIRLLGLRSDIPRLMLGSDLLLLPSLAEGLGMVAVEAQAAGLRVLSSDTTPRECVVIPDLVQFQSLERGAACWANDVLRLVELPRPDLATCNSAVKNSAFSIESSAAQLLQLYAGARYRPPALQQF